MNSKSDKPKRPKRKLTPFLCHEMLYEYEQGLLDPSRKAAVEGFLEGDKEGQSLLEAIRRGDGYATKLGSARVRSDVMAHLRDAENAISLGRRYSSWQAWPETLRWSITAIVVSSVVAFVVAFTPWSKLNVFSSRPASSSVELAQIPSNLEALQAAKEAGEVPDLAGQAEEVAGLNAGLAGRDEEESPILEIEAPPQAKEQPRETVAANGKLPSQAAPTTGALAPTVSAQVPSRVGGIAPATSIDESPTDAESSQTGGRRESKAKGFVYRAFMTLSELATIAPKITDEIRALGGEKAGEVELGWKRGSGHYYHFAMPEANEERLLEKLRAYGPVRISKDPHPRVMPQGQVRFILWIESAD